MKQHRRRGWQACLRHSNPTIGLQKIPPDLS
jgi:hypothetical protein